MEERRCKNCNCCINNMNLNTIYCSESCRKKWDYKNKQGLRERKIKDVLERRKKSRMI